MNKSYAAGDIEKKAKQVLAGIEVTCPDKVWQELTFELEQKHGSTEAMWKNKLNSPTTLIIALVVITASTLFLWKFLSGKNDMPAISKTQEAPPPKQDIVTPPVHNTPPPVVKKDTVAPKHDSVIAHTTPPATTVPVAVHNNLPAPMVPVIQVVSNPNALSPRQQRALMKAKRDSIAKANNHVTGDTTGAALLSGNSGRHHAASPDSVPGMNVLQVKPQDSSATR